MNPHTFTARELWDFLQAIAKGAITLKPFNDPQQVYDGALSKTNEPYSYTAIV